MENASKALIIAGAILVSIILISLGIMVMNSTGNVTGRMQEEMDSTAIQSFNSKFTQYAGKQKGSTIKELINTMQSSNASSDHKVEIELTSTKFNGTLNAADKKNGAKIQAALKLTTTYTVNIDTNQTAGSADQGYVNKITIAD